MYNGHLTRQLLDILEFHEHRKSFSTHSMLATWVRSLLERVMKQINHTVMKYERHHHTHMHTHHCTIHTVIIKSTAVHSRTDTENSCSSTSCPQVHLKPFYAVSWSCVCMKRNIFTCLQTGNCGQSRSRSWTQRCNVARPLLSPLTTLCVRRTIGVCCLSANREGGGER